MCLATAALKAGDVNHDGTIGASDEWPVLRRPTGSNLISSYPSHEAASVGIGQSSAEDGTALVEVNDEHAHRAPHLKPKRSDEARSFVERFGVSDPPEAIGEIGPPFRTPVSEAGGTSMNLDEHRVWCRVDKGPLLG